MNCMRQSHAGSLFKTLKIAGPYQQRLRDFLAVLISGSTLIVLLRLLRRVPAETTVPSMVVMVEISIGAAVSGIYLFRLNIKTHCGAAWSARYCPVELPMFQNIIIG